MEGVLRCGSRRACQTRLVVSMLIMSDEARSERPQVAAIGCRCMNSSTALLAWLNLRSSPAQRMVWRMLAADNCGIMRAHSAEVRLVPWATRVRHQIHNFVQFGPVRPIESTT